MVQYINMKDNNYRNVIRNRNKNKKNRNLQPYSGLYIGISSIFLCLGMFGSGIYKCFDSNTKICSPYFNNFSI